MVELIDDKPAADEPAAPDDSEQLARQQAIKQVKARRLFKVGTTASAAGVALLVPIWAATEYQHAGGWAVYGRKPAPEGEIGRETEGQPGAPG